MGNNVLCGFEFIEPLIRDVRDDIEIKYKIKLNKDVIDLRNFDEIDQYRISRIAATWLYHAILDYLIQLNESKLTDIRAKFILCEMKHSPLIQSELWPRQHCIVSVYNSKRSIYIDPLTSILHRIDPNTPDVYISEGFPPYLSLFRDHIYHNNSLFYHIEYNIKGKLYDWISKIFHLRDK